MNHKDELHKIYSDAFAKMPEQITIDLIEEFVGHFITNRDLKENPIRRDETGAAHYDVDILLDVYDKKFTWDITLLNRLLILFENWGKEIEYRNKILGIPREEG